MNFFVSSEIPYPNSTKYCGQEDSESRKWMPAETTSTITIKARINKFISVCLQLPKIGHVIAVAYAGGLGGSTLPEAEKSVVEK